MLVREAVHGHNQLTLSALDVSVLLLLNLFGSMVQGG